MLCIWWPANGSRHPDMRHRRQRYCSMIAPNPVDVPSADNMATKSFVLICLFALLALASPVQAAPHADGGGFPPTDTPTPEPSFTPLPTETPTATDTQQVLAVTVELPIASDTPFALDFEQPSNVLAEPSASEPSGLGANPLTLVMYMVLFIALVAGIWMLFGRRAGRNQP